jgi:hypothetical protein
LRGAAHRQRGSTCPERSDEGPSCSDDRPHKPDRVLSQGSLRAAPRPSCSGRRSSS